jgi:hypothetical protein
VIGLLLLAACGKGPAVDTAGDTAGGAVDGAAGDTAGDTAGGSAGDAGGGGEDTAADTGDTGALAEPPLGCGEGQPAAVFVGEQGWAALDDTLGAGDPESSVLVVLNEPGALHLCPAVFYAALRIEADIEVLGAGAGLTTLDAGGAAPVIHVEGARAVSLSGLTLRGGLAQHGGGVYATLGAELWIRDSELVDSAAWSDGHGGGMCLSEASLATLERVRFAGNQASEGGGMAVMDSTATLTEVSFEGNAAVAGEQIAGYGGGFYTEGGQVRLEQVRFLENEAAASGGGAAGWYDSVLELEGAEFTGNVAGDKGGGLHLLFAEATASGLRFEGDSAGAAGGAAALKYAALALSESAIAGAGAPLGGGVELYASELTLTEVSLEGAAATEAGGGLYLSTGSQATGEGCSFTGCAPEDLYVEGVGGFSAADAFSCDGEGCR